MRLIKTAPPNYEHSFEQHLIRLFVLFFADKRDTAADIAVCNDRRLRNHRAAVLRGDKHLRLLVRTTFITFAAFHQLLQLG